MSKYVNLIFLGAPGSGKGTQAKKLVDEKGYSHLSTGDLLRAEIQKGTKLGKKVNDVVSAGHLVSDDLVLELLKANCDLNNNNYIFDGFPRNSDQSHSLQEQVLCEHASKALYFNIDLNELEQRLINRRMCSGCGEIYNVITSPPKDNNICFKCGSDVIQRKDDTKEVVKNRLNVFSSTIDNILSYYKERGTLVKVDASQDQSVVFEQILKIL